MSEQSAKILRSFLNSYSIPITEFAEVTDLSRFTIHKYLKGHKISRKAALKIEKNVTKHYRILLPHEKLID